MSSISKTAGDASTGLLLSVLMLIAALAPVSVAAAADASGRVAAAPCHQPSTQAA